MINPFRRCWYCTKLMIVKKLQGRQKTIKGIAHPMYIPSKGDIVRYACLDCEMQFDED